ncbi:pilus assembly protein PilC [Luteimonas sp. BDR2-5]|uniref:pilus assembly protein n=1 Tax=Proluteimonas luteida TaxID=2878685 RepID=UPI001E65300C|nr:PilC/PilY family type IV pilus protein [Luteimonas sp. BDR2-5]MCD9029783.1 pilus assembly protein PilC [Luteimonas sp. BDR2-5]
MNIPLWLRFTLIAAAGTGLFLGRGAVLDAAPGDYVISQTPLYLGDQVPPLMMMVMSRDERLFTKAYSDYSDLDGDGRLDTTYQDTFAYSGYFDSKLCYSYSNSQFKAVAVAVGANGHSCNGQQWSGNFLNWVTMSRLDILRYVLYGGKRIVDEPGRTVLERAHIPNDLHAWVKVYDGGDINEFTPLSGTQSFCNSSHSNNADEPPVFRQAGGNWSEWAATALYQCRTNHNSDTPGSATSYTVRVEVCDAGVAENLREDFCRPYSNGTTTRYKPAGLLQSYGENGRLRFGMVSGSYSNPRSGGVLRSNISRFSGNGTGCSAGNEINLATGQLCNQNSGDEGIINTLDRFRLTQWNGWTSDSKWGDCNDWGILNRQGQGRSRSLNNPGTGNDDCSAWGNPIAEMYAEALRYIAGESSATSGFNAGSDLSGLPKPNWLDPYRDPASGGNSYCATCNILVMSSGLPSFDSDEIPSIPRIGSVDAATNAVGVAEGVSGSYLVGRVGATPLHASLNTHEDVCSAENVSGLADVRGICPDIPSLEGSYLVSGMAYKARTTDLRPGLQGKPSSHLNTVNTYAVALADNLPKFDVPVGGRTISLAPLCQANASGSAAITDAGWRTCALGSVGVGAKEAAVSPGHVYGRDLVYDANGNAVAGSFSLVWEDSLWGNDHDNDVVAMLTYCVGSACNADTNPRNNAGYSGKDICWRSDSSVCGASGSPTVGANEVLVRIENLSAYAGNAMLTGFAVTGSNNDGVYRLARRPGSSDNSILTNQANPPGDWDKPKVMKFTAGSSDAGSLESPLWYAAKYGGFNDRNGNGIPDPGEWDSRETGQPDNYFFARDPSKLREELERIFEEAAGAGGPTGGGGAGARINAGSFTVETSFTPPTSEDNYWSGNVLGVRVGADGTRGTVLWNAATALGARDPVDRNIVVTIAPTRHEASGEVDEPVAADTFSYLALGNDDAARGAALGIPSPVPVWFTGAAASGENLVSYIAGSSQYEQGNGGPFRDRNSKLGDIVNSTPEIFQPNDDFGYSIWKSFSATEWKLALGTSYQEYLQLKAENRSPVVYVGANDGMLHAFDARDTGGGGELFGFIPAGARGHLFELANPNYQHRYYVDGGITVSDIATNETGGWKTLLVGSTGAGGPVDAGDQNGSSVFALDVSDPENFDKDDVRWEITGGNEPDLGYVLGKPLIVPVEVGGRPRWVALFGNGPNSASGFPVLYVADAWTGEVLARLRPSLSSYSASNGLMNVAPIAFNNGDGLVDTVYGGDLQGNLWKFDLSASTPTGWAVAFNGAPLFTASRNDVAQPITGGIEVASGPGGGVSLFFGTGRYFAVGDNAVNEVQSLYGIWDNCPANATVPCSTRIDNGRNALRGQAVTTGVNSSGHRTRDVTRGAVSYVTHRGWYVDLFPDATLSGERFIGTPTLQNGKVFFTTYEPTLSVCGSGGGVNWLYGLNVLTGGGGMAGVSLTPEGAGSGEDAVCTGDCGAIPLNPEDETGPPTRTSNIFVPPVVPCDPAHPDCDVDRRLELSKCTLVLRAVGAEPLFMPRPCGRQSWRQVR